MRRRPKQADFQPFAVEIPQNGELIDLRHVYLAGQQLRKSVGASGDKVDGTLLISDGRQTAQRHVSKQAVTGLLSVLQDVKYILSQHGVNAHFIELSMFDPSDPNLQAFFFTLYSDNEHFITSYRKEMEENMIQEIRTQSGQNARGMLVPNPALYAFPVTGVKRTKALRYKSRQKSSLYLGIFPGRLPASSVNHEIGKRSLKAVEMKAQNFMKSVLRQMESKVGGAATLDTALMVTFPRPAGNGRISNLKLKLRGGSLFAYGGSGSLSADELETRGLKLSTILSRSVMTISQSQIEFQSNQRNMLRWFVHDAPKPLLIMRDHYLHNLRECAASKRNTADVLENCRGLQEQIDFAMASFHAYGFLGGAGLKWETEYKPTKIRSLVDTVLRVVTPDAGDIEFKRDVPEISSFVDPQKYMAILYCLLDNAVTAITRSTQNGKLPQIEINVKKGRSSFTTTITDNGCGIEEEDMPKICQEGFSRFESSGLGLGIVSGFLKMANSKFEVKSIPKQGSTFSFELPLDRNI